MTHSPTTWTSTGPVPNPILHGDPGDVRRLASKMFDKAYAQLTFPAGTLNKYTMPGLILALNSVTSKYVPWRADAAYGAGSDTAVGFLNEKLVLSEWDRFCTPIYDAQVIEANMYTDAGVLGTVPAAVKTDLPEIGWR